jgi:hypothetical protein
LRPAAFFGAVFRPAVFRAAAFFGAAFFLRAGAFFAAAFLRLPARMANACARGCSVVVDSSLLTVENSFWCRRLLSRG